MKLFLQRLRRDRTNWNWLLAFLLLTTYPSNAAIAGGGFSYTGPQLPNRQLGYSTQSALQIKLESAWVGNRGYWPVQVQVSSATASTADRQVTIRFSAGRRYNQSPPITVEQDFELVQGDSTASIKLLVPQLTDWRHCSWEVWVDGILDEQLSLQYFPFNLANNDSSAATVVPRRSNQILSGSVVNNLTGYGGYDFSTNNSELPEKWLDYSTVDIVVARPEDLQEWKRESSTRFRALLRWDSRRRQFVDCRHWQKVFQALGSGSSTEHGSRPAIR